MSFKKEIEENCSNYEYLEEMFFKKRIKKKLWKEFLNSNEGLFKKLKVKKGFIGPTINDSNGRIMGDLLAVEIMLFSNFASDSQMNFHQNLLKHNEIEAIHYLLIISGFNEKWKKDFKIIEKYIENLKKEESFEEALEKTLIHIEKESEEITKIEEKLELTNINNIDRFIKILNKHFPEKIKENITNSKELIIYLDKLEKENKDEIKYLEEYIEKSKKKYYYLF